VSASVLAPASLYPFAQFTFDEQREFKVVRAAIYFLRSLGSKVSAERVIAHIRLAAGTSPHKRKICAYMKALFASENQRTGTKPELNGTRIEPDLSTNCTVSEPNGTRPEHSADLEIRKKDKDESSVGCASKRVRVEIETEPVSFEPEDERKVQLVLAAVAERNKSGTVSVGRIANLRFEMAAELVAVGAARWRYGMEQAAQRSMPWVYARKVMRGTLEVPQFTAQRDTKPLWQKPAEIDPYENLRRRAYAEIGIDL
jgi:hypothetical protein